MHQSNPAPESSSTPSKQASPVDPGILEKTAIAFNRNTNEARSLDVVDRADNEVEGHFSAGKRTSDSPGFKAVWSGVDQDAFKIEAAPLLVSTGEAMKACLDLVRNFRDTNTLYGTDKKIPEAALKALGPHGYWGMLIEKEFGGQGCSFAQFTNFLMNMAKLDSTVAGLASIHGCIGAVDPLQAFGTPGQKARYLPLLASGERLSAFALTEPNAGSDLTALRTTAVLDGDNYIVNGEKLFISNSGPGRTLGLVVKIDGKPAVLIADLPETENENFRFKDYGIYALQHLWNRGLVFTNFKVPKENLLDATQGGSMKGDGLTIAYHGLNRGRVSLCANAAGTISALLADTRPWADYRITYTKPIAQRNLIQARLGHSASLAIGCEAMALWCANLLDKGYRGEVECIAAKNFGAKALRTTAIDDIMKTAGGRSFLAGHAIGDNLHDLFAPTIYEGEEDMLSMAYLKAMVKDHAETYFVPLATKVAAMKQEGKVSKSFDPTKAPALADLINHTSGLWQLKKELTKYGMWVASEAVTSRSNRPEKALPSLPRDPEKQLASHHAFAVKGLQFGRWVIDSMMRKYGPGLADEQLEMIEVSKDLQRLLVMSVVSQWGTDQKDPTLKKAATALCWELRQEVIGAKQSVAHRKLLVSVGKDVLEGKFDRIAGLNSNAVLQPYKR